MSDRSKTLRELRNQSKVCQLTKDLISQINKSFGLNQISHPANAIINELNNEIDNLETTIKRKKKEIGYGKHTKN